LRKLLKTINSLLDYDIYSVKKEVIFYRKYMINWNNLIIHVNFPNRISGFSYLIADKTIEENIVKVLNKSRSIVYNMVNDDTEHHMLQKLIQEKRSEIMA
jgi:hypothetical protein